MSSSPLLAIRNSQLDVSFFSFSVSQVPSPFRLDPVSRSLEAYVQRQGGNDEDVTNIAQMLKKRFKDHIKEDRFVAIAESLSINEMKEWLSHRDQSEIEAEERSLFKKLKQQDSRAEYSFQKLMHLLYPMDDKKICRLFGRLMRGADCTYHELIDLFYFDASGGWQGLQKMVDLCGSDLDSFLPQNRQFYVANRMQVILDGIRVKIGACRVGDKESYPHLISALMSESNGAERVGELMNALEMEEEERVPIIKFLIQNYLQCAIQAIPSLGVKSQASRIDLAYFAIEISARAAVEEFRCFQIEDAAQRGELAKFCAKKSPYFTACCIGNFELEDRLDDLVDVIKTCMREKPEKTSSQIPQCYIEDQRVLVDLARFWIEVSASHTGKLLATLPLFGIQDPAEFVALMKNCAAKDGLVGIEDLEKKPEEIVLAILEGYVWASPMANPEMTIKTALEFMKNMVGSKGFKVSKFTIFHALITICAQKKPRLTYTYLNQVGISDKALIIQFAGVCRKYDKTLPLPNVLF